jgi:CO/xanthine dehydrogenase FAD-binding subunit
LPAPCQALQEAARVVGSIQIQNAGTIGGNLCAAAATADGIPPLLALSAEVELRSAAGRRSLPLAAFLLGARRTARRPDELLARIRIRRPASGRVASRFVKLAQRAYQAPAVVSVAGVVHAGADGRIADAAFAVGGCASVAKRLPSLERRLAGRRAADGPWRDLFDAADDLALLCPTDDARVSARYRLAAARTLVCRMLDRLEADLR